MKRAVALFFLTTYLLFATELSQLLKIPAFVTHFTEHQQENNDLTIWEFICIHYAHGNVKDADYEQDMKLPFKTHDNYAAQISITAPPAPVSFPEVKITHFPTRKKYYTEDVSQTTSFPSIIWQPPRAC